LAESKLQGSVTTFYNPLVALAARSPERRSERSRFMPGLIKTSNPALNANTFEDRFAIAGDAMTLRGTVNKTGLLLLCAVATAAWTCWLASTKPEASGLWLWGGLIGGLVFAIGNLLG
jgi:uncharacterized YccA/Bax inhibitor family protein